jgi:hydroxymethylglutaryl-CoA reductase (NADPH)
MSDDAIVEMVLAGRLPHHQLENVIEDAQRCVLLRRRVVQHTHLRAAKADGGFVDRPHSAALSAAVEGVPSTGAAFDSAAFYATVKGANCENVVGFVPIPVGIVGPLLVDGEEVRVPLATTEGALIASTNRGARALSMAGGVRTEVLRDGMTRAPVVQMTSMQDAAALKHWAESPHNLTRMQQAFSTTTRFGQLQSVLVSVAGRNVFMRFRCFTGDAMGMNMISKGVEAIMGLLRAEFPTMRLLALSGNVCTDKKPSAINWIEGRGKSVCVEATLPSDIITKVLKTTVHDVVELNIAKNFIGSCIAGSIGGNNAHASNIVTALYLATGQDAAQNVESSTCMTLFEPVNSGKDLHVSVTMPSIEVGTVGGGTSLPAQAACLRMMGLHGPSKTAPGDNSKRLARIVAATVLAGELSLMSALAAGHLVSSHMRLNRKHGAK